MRWEGGWEGVGRGFGGLGGGRLGVWGLAAGAGAGWETEGRGLGGCLYMSRQKDVFTREAFRLFFTIPSILLTYSFLRFAETVVVLLKSS